MTAPPSKSMAHRYLICAGLCKGTSVISGIDKSEDVLATIDCLHAIGAKVTWRGSDAVVTGAEHICTDKKHPLACRESGSTQRFFVPLCLVREGEAVLTGKEGLFKRPLDVYKKICAEQSIAFEQSETELYLNGVLRAGDYKVKGNISSQFISGLLFALPLLKEDSKITILPPIESRPYINLTISALKKFGVEAAWLDDKTIVVKGGQSYRCTDTRWRAIIRTRRFLRRSMRLAPTLKSTDWISIRCRVTRHTSAIWKCSLPAPPPFIWATVRTWDRCSWRWLRQKTALCLTTRAD